MRVWILLVLFVFIGAVVAQDVNIDDNDFAEFEDFDDDEEGFVESDTMGEEDEDDAKQQQSEQQQQQQQQQKHFIQEEEEEEDFDEAVVEDEDETDDFDHFSDPEEFEGYDSDMPQSAGNSRPRRGQEEPKITIAKVPLHLRSNWDSFYLEMLMIAGLVVYFINFIVGKNKNQKLANAWFASHRQLLEQNFKLVGDDGKQQIEDAGLQKESENVYTLWCSGRVCVEGMLVELKFIKRQDLIGVITQMLRPVSDQLIIKVDLEEMDTFVFAVSSKKTAQKISKEMTDVSTFCPERKSCDKFGIGSQFQVMSEIGETAAVILDQKTVAVINKCPTLVETIHISDQYSGPKQPDDGSSPKLPEVTKTLMMVFNFPGKGRPSTESMDSMRPLLQLVFHLVDKLKRFKLSKEAKVKADKNRARVEEAYLKATHAARAEMAQAKREEKKRAERERMLEIDDPDRQRKWEERENRRQQKKRAPKMKQLKVG